MAILEIKNNYLSVGINTLGAELMYVSGADKTEYLWNGNKEVWSSRAPILFPICGGLKEDKYIYNGNEYVQYKHGFAKDMEFLGEKLSETKAEFVLTSSLETLKGFPFDFKLTVVYELEKNSLKVSYITDNLSDKTMYFSIGAHEGYACPEGIEEYEIRFDEEQTLDSFILNGNLLENNSIRIIENSKVLPLKYEYFAVDALVFKNVDFKKVRLVHKTSGKKVVVEFDEADYFLLWTKPGAKYICLEPWCGVQDIMNSDFNITKKEGIIALTKGESHRFTHVISCY